MKSLHNIFSFLTLLHLDNEQLSFFQCSIRFRVTKQVRHYFGVSNTPDKIILDYFVAVIKQTSA